MGVVDPDQPRRRLDAVVASLRPNAVVDHSGTSKLDGGRRLPAGIAAVVSTSGTTGGPRSVLLSRAAVEASARAVTDGLGIQPGADRWLACLPLHAVAGLAIVARSYFCGTPLTVHPGFSVDRGSQRRRDVHDRLARPHPARPDARGGRPTVAVPADPPRRRAGGARPTRPLRRGGRVADNHLRLDRNGRRLRPRRPSAARCRPPSRRRWRDPGRWRRAHERLPR